MDLRPFQRTFIRAATAPRIDTAALSLPRSNGKSALAGYLVSRILDPGDKLFRPRTESVLCAASIEHARIVFCFAREVLEPAGGYRFLDNHTRIGIVHKQANTRLRVIGSNGKTAMGLVGCPWAICDEPGAWEVNGGTLLHDAIETAKGKPGSPLRALYIGTLAPATAGWWHDLIDDGTQGSTYVQALRALQNGGIAGTRASGAIPWRRSRQTSAGSYSTNGTRPRGYPYPQSVDHERIGRMIVRVYSRDASRWGRRRSSVRIGGRHG